MLKHLALALLLAGLGFAAIYQAQAVPTNCAPVSGSGVSSVTFNGPFPPGSNYQIDFSFAATTFRMYSNGVEEAAFPAASMLLDSSEFFTTLNSFGFSIDSGTMSYNGEICTAVVPVTNAPPAPTPTDSRIPSSFYGAAFYSLTEQAIQIYTADGNLVLYVSAEEVDSLSADGLTEPLEIAHSDDGLYILYLMPGGNFAFSVGPDFEQKVYVLIFTRQGNQVREYTFVLQ